MVLTWVLAAAALLASAAGMAYGVAAARRAARIPALTLGLDLLDVCERRYAEAITAVVNASPDPESDADVERWRGHAEAYRQMAERIREGIGYPPENYRSREWREQRGVPSG